MVSLYRALPLIAEAKTGAGATVKVRVTAVAAVNEALPAWLAVMPQVPVATRVSAVPLTVQMVGVVDAKLTASPELLVALKAGAATPMVWLAGAAKVMTWACGAATGAAATVTVLTTSVAAA